MSDTLSDHQSPAPRGAGAEPASATPEHDAGGELGSGHRRLENAKAELLRRALVGAGIAAEPALISLVKRFYRHVAPEDLIGREPADIVGAVLGLRALAESRPQGTAVVHAFNPDGTREATGSYSVVDVVTDDMPFLVDSISAELTGAGFGVNLLVHPQYVVRRDLTGALLEVLDVSSTELPEGAIVESWMHVEMDRVTDPAALIAIESSLAGVLRDVREAVEDWPRMRHTAVALADALEAEPPPTVPAGESSEAVEFLRWLADNHFTFLGYREYDLAGAAGDEGLLGVHGSGLGILRADAGQSEAFAKLPPAARARATEPHILVLTRANARSTVHRRTYLDYVGIKRFDANGVVNGERRFLGLFTSSAYTQSVSKVPILRRKIEQVLERSGFRRDGHSYKDLMEVLETYPRDELFQIDADSLYDVATAVLHIQERRQTRLFIRQDPYGRFISALVFLPRDRYTTTVRRRMEAVLVQELGSTQLDYTARVTESTSARLHFVVRLPAGAPMPHLDEAALEARMIEATRSWEDDFADALVEQCGEDDAAGLLKVYGAAFPESYKEDFQAATTVSDVRALESLGVDDAIGLNLYETYTAEGSESRFKVYRFDEPISLSSVLPVLTRMGVEVTDERPYEIESTQRRAWIYDFGLEFAAGAAYDLSTLKERFQAAFLAAWNGAAEVDGFQALVVAAGLTWREAATLRAYARYLQQTRSSFSQSYLESTLVSNVRIARRLTRIFRARFDPDFATDRDEAVAGFVAEIEGLLESVPSLDQDRILRSFLALLLATTRTNAYQLDEAGAPKTYLSFKFDPSKVPDLPKPLPRFEIWVYSPRVEGVHLRFGKVARGGLRWSDRREDFRTEVLGLVKAQMVKNAVIVPVGAKGGFVAKQAPDPSQDRDAWLAEGIACYKTFISGLLDVTDNLSAGQVVPARDVVRHDGDDTYLVVAADKGTATFSDIANGVAADYGYWLGDAFASGGSEGYDHKAMGITARGAWESVKRHFRELDVDTQTQDFTVVGVGDMSGDVFGNGMLLSEHIRLVAAFDHRHVFLDPDPDAVTSYAERRRLFDLPRSSWADYNPELLSTGGGIYPRTAKSIPVSNQVRRALALPDNITKLTPTDLMKAVLSAPVDLVWNGGIGTYIKSRNESHLDVGDKANDAIRVDGADLQCRVLGEGGNLGATQLGRIEAAMRGVRLNTDAIDNSAGVDTSDHEVNIKILLDQVVRDGQLAAEQRHGLLIEMTEEIASLVLADNYLQNMTLGIARGQAPSMITVHQRFIASLEAAGELDRSIEYLPTDAQFVARAAAGEGLTSPELAVLLAYAKITLTADLLETGVADEPWFERAMRSYFPTELVERFDDRLDAHPLRTEIITCVAVNDMVNRGGITYAFRAMEETGAGPAEVLRAYFVTREVFSLQDFWHRVEALDGTVPTAAQRALHQEARRLLDRSTRWILQARGGTVDVGSEIERFREQSMRIAPLIPQMLVGVEHERLVSRAAEIEALGAPADLCMDAAGLLDLFGVLDCVDVANATGADPLEVAALYFAVSERYEVDLMLNRITMLPRDDRWSALARAALRSDLYVALVGMTRRIIESVPDVTDPILRIQAWESRQAEGLARTRATLDEIANQDKFDLATLSVALRAMRTLVAQGS
ncbi:MAG TPA: NAD-glutamate dehydrogenase [Candidatus Nanopelagicales bacterium]